LLNPFFRITCGEEGTILLNLDGNSSGFDRSRGQCPKLLYKHLKWGAGNPIFLWNVEKKPGFSGNFIKRARKLYQPAKTFELTELKLYSRIQGV
jgi:hypothetical protein